MNLNNETSGTQVVDKETWSASIQRLYGDVSELFVRESQLIRAEVNEKVTDLKTVAIEFVTSGVVLFVGLLCVAATAIICLNLVVPLWAAALIVTAAFLIIGGVLFAAAKKKVSQNSFTPNKSIAAFGEISHTLKEKVHEITKH